MLDDIRLINNNSRSQKAVNQQHIQKSEENNFELRIPYPVPENKTYFLGGSFQDAV